MALSKIEPASLDVGQIGGRRNYIINGAYQIWQRGTSFSSAGYTADHFEVGGTITSVSRQNFPAGSAVNETGHPFKHYVRLNGSQMYLYWPIEDIELLGGVEVTASYWARISSGSVQLNPFIGQVGISGGDVWTSFGGNTISNSGWQRFSHTMTIPSLSGKTINANSHTDFHMSGVNTNGANLDIVGVQLEVGSVATPFEHRSYGEELALCQRYYRLIGTYGDPYATQGNYILNDVTYNNENRMKIPYLNPPMRSTPSVTHVNWSNGGTGALTEFSSGTVRSQTGMYEVTPFGGGYAQFNGNFGNPARYVAIFDAEL